MSNSLTRSIRKFFSRLTLSYLLSLSLLFNIFAPVITLTTPVVAEDYASPTLSFNAGNNHFDFSLSPVTSHVEHALYYRTSDKIEAAFGGGDPTGSSYYTSIYAGTESNDDLSPHNVLRGILKYHLGDTTNAYYFVMDGNTARHLTSIPATDTSLTSDEETWLNTGVFPDRTAPSIPINGAPNGTTITTNNFDFTWDPSIDEGVVSYEFQSTRNPAQVGGVLTTQLWHSSVLPTNLIHSSGAPDGIWYWQVRAKDASGNYSAWSQIWNVTLDTTAPIAPVLSAPSNNAFVSGNPLQTWSAVPDANHYVYESDYEPTFTLPLIYTTNLSTNSKLVTGNQTISFYWRVKAVDAAGNESPWSQTWKLNVDNADPIVDLLTPLTSLIKGAIDIRGSVTDANPYRYYAVIFDYSNHVVAGPGTVYDSTSFLDKLLFTWDTLGVTDGDYRVQLAARDRALNRGVVSEENITVTVDNTPPAAPIITMPIAGNDYIASQPIRNEWSIPADTYGIKEYRIEYIYDDGRQVNRTETRNYRNHVPALWEQGGVKFHVKAVDNADNEGEWSDWRHYFYDATKPSVPVLTWPVDGLAINDNTPLMQWEDSTDNLGVAKYYYRVRYNCSNPNDVATCASTYPNETGSPVPVSELQAGVTGDGVYFWQVKAEDLAGNQSDWSAYEKVTIDTTAPAVPTLRSLSDGAVIKGIAFDQKWYPVSDAVLYEYESCYTDPGDAGAPCSHFKWGATYTGTTKHVAAGQPNSHFWWRVRAKDAAGNWSPWSESWEMIIDKTAPVLSSKTTFSGWYTSPQTSTFTYLDNESSIVSGADVSCEITTEGENQTCTVTPNVCDAAGNCNTTAVTSNGANIDLTAPTSEINLPANDGDNSTVITNIWDGLIAGTALDSVSGVDRVELSIRRSDGDYWSGTEWVNGSESTVRIPAIGTTAWSYNLPGPVEDTYTITSHAKDLAGNVENSFTVTVILDKTIPEVALAINPAEPDADKGWYKTQPEITLTASDAYTSIDRIEYQWDSQTGSWTVYSSSFKPVSEGAHVLYYLAYDKAGNHTETGIKNVKWDQTALTDGPQNVSVSPNPTSSDKATVSWDKAQDAVGIDRYEVQWKLGDTVHTASVGPDIFKYEINELVEGNWSVTVKAFDTAGNSKEASASLMVDRTAPLAPNLTLTGTSAGTANLSWGTITGASHYTLWYGTSSGNYIYGANVGNVTNYTVQGLGAGNYYFVVKANDAAGNSSGNSNEVSTGDIAGTPGVTPGTPAEGFVPAGEVQGEQTTATPAPSADNGSVLGDSSSLSNLLTKWWFWLLLVLISSLGYLLAHRRK